MVVTAPVEPGQKIVTNPLSIAERSEIVVTSLVILIMSLNPPVVNEIVSEKVLIALLKLACLLLFQAPSGLISV